MSNTGIAGLTVQEIVALIDLDVIRQCAIGNGSLADAIRRSGKFSPGKYYDHAERMVWAIWRGGRLLREAERQQGARHDLTSSDDRNKLGLLATIKLHGLKRDMAYRWIAIGWAEEEEVHVYVAKQKDTSKPLKLSDLVKLGKKNMPVELPAVGDDYRIIHADLIDADIEPESIDCIITDPPYPQEFIQEYAKLSTFAARVLKPGGSCLAMAGQSYLPEVIAALSSQLTYQWALAYLTPGGQAVQQWSRHVNTFWKPVLWFVKGKFEGSWTSDVIKSDVNDNDKRFHEWGQSESGMARIVENFSNPGDLIVDPFVGGGTTAVAALSRGRRFIGVDRNKEAVADTLRRIAALPMKDEAA